jgi:Tfp pilus assembly protein PilF
MKGRTLLFVGLFFAAPLCCFPQSVAPPLTRAEILGRLALAYSPSYVAHLVKTRGVNFSADYHFLSLVDLGGGTGILHQRLSSAEPKSTSSSSPDSGAPYDDLGKCAEFLKLGYPEKAEPECRSSMDENPRSPWPVLAALRAIRNGPEKAPDAEALARRAAELGPNLPEAHNELARSAGAAESMSEVQHVGALTSDALKADPLFYLSLEAGGVPGGFSQNDLAHPVETEADIRRRIAVDPDVATTHSYASSFYQATSQPDRAILEIRKALELEPDNPDFHKNLADLLGARGDTESEISELRAAIRCKPYEISRRVYLAERLDTLGRSAESLKEFDDLIKSKPADWDANNQVTDFLVQHKMVPAAIADLRLFLKATANGKVEGDFPETAEGIRFERQEYLARLLRSNGELNAAAAEYRDLLRTHSDDANVHDDYGVVLFAQGKRDEAAGEFREALRLGPNFATAHNNLALCMARKSQFDAAIDEFRKALAADPDNQRSRTLLGMAYASKGDFASAISEINEAIREDEGVPEPHVFLARVYSLKKDEAAALSELKSVLGLQPENAQAENEIAWLLATASNPKLRDPQSSLQHATHAVALLKDSPQAPSMEMAAFLDTLAEAQLLTGHPAEALTTEESAVKLDPNNAEIQSRLQRFRDAAAPKSATVKH